MILNIGEKIKNARKSSGLSQQQLGGDEFTKGYISQIEQGHVNPSLKVLTIISERLKMPISYFLDEENMSSNKFEEKFILGENLYFQGEYSEAASVFTDIINISFDVKSSFYCKSMLYLGKCLFYLNNYTKGISVLIKALDYISSIPLFNELVDCYDYIGHCYFNLNDFKEAIAEYTKALEIIQDKGLNIQNKKAKLFLNIGTAFSNIGNYKTAMQYFEKNISHCQGNHILDTLLDCYVRMAYCSYKLETYSASKQYISRALSVNKGLNCSMVNTEIYCILALLLGKEGKVEPALKLLKKANEIASDINYEFGYNLSIAYTVQILIDDSRIDVGEVFALEHMNKLLSARDKLPLYLLQGLLGNIYLKKGDIKRAEEYLKTAIENFIRINFNWEAAHYSKLLADMIIGFNPKEAKYYYNLSIQYISKVV